MGLMTQPPPPRKPKHQVGVRIARTSQGPEEEPPLPGSVRVEGRKKKKMNKNKNTVSLDSKAGDVLTPVEGGCGVGGGSDRGMGDSGNRDPGNLAFLEHGSPFRFLRGWETSSSRTTMKKPQNFNILDETPSPTLPHPPPDSLADWGGRVGGVGCVTQQQQRGSWTTQCLADSFTMSEVVHTGLFMRPLYFITAKKKKKKKKNSLLQLIKYYIKWEQHI